MPKTRVMVIDDSALMRQLLTQILSQDPGLEVVGSAAEPYTAWEKIKQLQPDVLTLDVEMPKMDGLTFLGKLMQLRPMPVVMVSTLTERGCETTLRALELGAVDFVAKPKIDVRTGTVDLAEEICEKVKGARQARVGGVRRGAPLLRPVVTKSHTPILKSTQQIIAIGASTGGTEAICEVLSHLPPDSPGVVMVLHMPAGFTRSYAARLDQMCALKVREAVDGDRVLSGHALLAPGGLQMSLRRSGADYLVSVSAGPPVNRHCPSVDVLFDSCAKYAGANTVGVLLTGMGNDGAKGLLNLRNSGAQTIAQDEATSVVFGMPREAIQMGAASEVQPLGQISSRLRALSAHCGVR